MNPKEGGIEAFQNKFFQKLLNHKKIAQNCNVYKYWWKLQTKQILSGNFVYKVELENT